MENLKKRLIKELKEIKDLGYSKSLFIIFSLYTKESKIVLLDCMFYPREDEETPNVEGLVTSPYMMKILAQLQENKFKALEFQASYIRNPNDLFICPVLVRELIEKPEKDEDVELLRSVAADEVIKLFKLFYAGIKEEFKDVKCLYDVDTDCVEFFSFEPAAEPDLLDEEGD